MTNARKSREKRKLEETKKAEEQIAIDVAASMMEQYLVFNCSGTLGHLHSCDTNCGTSKMTDTEIELYEEKKRWDALGMEAVGKPHQMPVPGIPVDIFHVEMSLLTLIDAIVEAGVLSKEELDAKFSENMLERLTRIREANEENVKAQRARMQLGVSPTPEIILPPNVGRKH